MKNATKNSQKEIHEYDGAGAENYTRSSGIIYRWDGQMTWFSNKIEAKNKILGLFIKRKELDYGEIMSELGFDLEIIVEICEELEKEGKIKTIKEEMK